MDEVRIRDNSINKNIDLYLEELKREHAAREKQSAELDGAERERSGNGAMSLDDGECIGEEDKDEHEKDCEEEYVMLDLDDVFHGAPVPNFAYTLSGLDTLTPILTLDNGLKLIGHYVDTIGTVVVYSEKEKEALPPSADPNPVNNEKRSLKRIRGVCKLERKLKFCAVPIAYRPARNDASTGDTTFAKTTADGNSMQAQGAMPTDNAPVSDARPCENESLDDARPAMNASVDPARVTDDTLLRNVISMENSSVEIAKPGEDVARQDTRPVEGESGKDVLLGNASPEGGGTLEIAKTTEDTSFENVMPSDYTPAK